MSQGVIKKLISDKGFGFIEGDKGELFFHHSAVEGASFETLREGQSVEYTEGSGPKGPRAESVSVI
ncbi:MAG: cold shock domain-containing protein [Pirellulaceae bacterium]|nr:cold shock domain-containing protein [Pirellulaceae bacterium]